MDDFDLYWWITNLNQFEVTQDITFSFTKERDGEVVNVIKDETETITLAGGDFTFDEITNFVDEYDLELVDGDVITLEIQSPCCKATRTVFVFDEPDNNNGTVCVGETAWGGDEEGDGAGWWFYHTTDPAEQTLVAGQEWDAGTVTAVKDNGQWTITINFNPGWKLQDVNEPVKIQGYKESELPSSRPPGGLFTTYKGDQHEVTFADDGYTNFAIKLDVEYCG